VPCYRLPRLHTILAAQGVLDQAKAPIERTVRGALLHGTARSQYPRGTNDGHDPLVRLDGSDVSSAPMARSERAYREGAGTVTDPVAG
jgi:hypothetical protein